MGAGSVGRTMFLELKNRNIQYYQALKRQDPYLGNHLDVLKVKRSLYNTILTIQGQGQIPNIARISVFNSNSFITTHMNTLLSTSTT